MSAVTRPPAHIAVLLALGAAHLLNDMMQSLIPAIYPIIKDSFALDFVQIGMITLTFQIAGSLFQPVVGMVTDRHPMPYATVVGMGFTLTGLVSLGYASNYPMILAAAACIGIGSSIFHPEATRMVRYAAGGRQGLGQGVFQIGGQTGGALGPLLAALIIVPQGQTSLAWFAAAALVAMMVLGWSAGQYGRIRERLATSSTGTTGFASRTRHSSGTVLAGLLVLSFLMFIKVIYHESFRSFYTFYLIERFGASIPVSQIMLFAFLVAAAVGVLVGGIIGDRIGRYRIIWISVLGPLPLTLLLPHVGFLWTGILSIMISLIMASAFASILIYAMELAPARVGLIGGLFYGLNFGLAGIGAGLLGALADTIGIYNVYTICAFLPLGGLLAWFLPRVDDRPPA